MVSRSCIKPIYLVGNFFRNKTARVDIKKPTESERQTARTPADVECRCVVKSIVSAWRRLTFSTPVARRRVWPPVHWGWWSDGPLWRGQQDSADETWSWRHVTTSWEGSVERRTKTAQACRSDDRSQDTTASTYTPQPLDRRDGKRFTNWNKQSKIMIISNATCQRFNE